MPIFYPTQIAVEPPIALTDLQTARTALKRFLTSPQDEPGQQLARSEVVVGTILSVLHMKATSEAPTSQTLTEEHIRLTLDKTRGDLLNIWNASASNPFQKEWNTIFAAVQEKRWWVEILNIMAYLLDKQCQLSNSAAAPLVPTHPNHTPEQVEVYIRSITLLLWAFYRGIDSCYLSRYFSPQPTPPAALERFVHPADSTSPYTWSAVKDAIRVSNIIGFLELNMGLPLTSNQCDARRELYDACKVGLTIGELESNVVWSQVCSEMPFDESEVLIVDGERRGIKSSVGLMADMKFVVHELWSQLHLSINNRSIPA